MSVFDGTVKKIIDAISAARREKQQEAAALSTAAENMFGNLGKLIEELRPALESNLPDLDPSVELGQWVKARNGATNTLKLKKKGVGEERNINLAIEHGKADVMINKKPFPSGQALTMVSGEIVRFFTEE